MAVHWFDHHGLVEWRDTAVEARHWLSTMGYSEILDQLVEICAMAQQVSR